LLPVGIVRREDVNKNPFVEVLITEAQVRGIPGVFVRRRYQSALNNCLWAVVGDREMREAVLLDLEKQYQKVLALNALYETEQVESRREILRLMGRLEPGQ
jgi:hypothetical protein